MNDSHDRPPRRPAGSRRPHHAPPRRGRREAPGERQQPAADDSAQPQPARPPRALRALRPVPGDISPVDVGLLLAEAERGTPPDLTDPRVVQRVLRRHGLRPNKGFGQHLLVDRDALEAMVAAAEVGPGDAVLEVGAGMGVLTAALAERAGRVVAVELEREILPVLRETTERFSNVELLPRNLLEVRPEEVFGQAPYKLVANLPYYITAPTLRHFLEAPNRPTRLVVMVQREVAARLIAAPGDLSLLGVSVQFYGTPRLVRLVPAGSFYPPPKVDSAIVRVDVHPEPPLDPATRDLLFGIVRAGFAERRKQLHNTLARHLHAPRAAIEAWLAAADIDPMRRAETLSIEEWIRLTRAAQGQV
jgi:16S rRNA (adenine1518-N6/adenine1519-N6)-dimethyltransferase